MSKKHNAFGRLDDHSLVEFAELMSKRGLLDTLVKRAPVFTKMSLGWYINLPTIPGRPAKEVSPGAGPEGFTLKFGFKAGEFSEFAKRERFYGVFAEFFSAKYFDKLQRCYEGALSLEANRILRRLQGRLAQQLPRTAYESLIDDLHQQIQAGHVWPPRQIILDVFNEIAFRFMGNGAPLRLYKHVIIWNTQRNGFEEERESRKFLGRLGRAVRDRPKEMFDGKDWAIMLLWDEMPRGIPRLARWRDEAALAQLKVICRDHAFSMDAYRDRLRKLGLSPEKPKLVKGSLNGDALVIKWAGPVRNLVKSHTGKN